MIATRLTFKLSRQLTLVFAISALALLGGCSFVNIKQLTYEMLRQEDCKLNQLDNFCTRTYAREYLEYERIRKEYLRSQTQTQWRVNREEIKIPAKPGKFSSLPI